MGRRKLEGLPERMAGPAVHSKICILLAIFLALGLSSWLAFNSASVRSRLPLILLAFVLFAVARALSLRFGGRTCMLCDFRTGESLSDFASCPRCNGMFGDVATLLPKGAVLDLGKYLSDARAAARLLGAYLAIAIFDGATEFRLAGRLEPSDDGEDAPGHSWHISLTAKGQAYELVTPPPLVGQEIDRLLREIHQRTAADAMPGPVPLRIAIADYSGDVELAVVESPWERDVTIIFTAETVGPWMGMKPYLQEFAQQSIDAVSR